jgi:hypothetical protein
MSRSGYSDDYDNLQLGRWRGIVASASRGKRGQSFFRDLIAALEAMPEKRLITSELEKEGAVCALGALGKSRGLNMASIDPEDAEVVAANFNIAPPLAQEVVYYNDEFCDHKTPEGRWEFMHKWAKSNLKTQEVKS